MQIRLASNIQPDSIVDGEGLRTVVWTQGCSHNCKGCHNPGTHRFDGGFLADTEDIKKQIADLSYQDGVTLSGGDPFFQVDAVLDIARFCQSKGINVWCYTGFTFDALLEMSKSKPAILELLRNIDVLVDGKFVLSLKSYDCKFRGSTNQRLIDVKKSLQFKRIVNYELKENKQCMDLLKPRRPLYV